jgi:predicted ATPase
MSERFIVISGCSGGGKSSLLAELARRGHAVVEEPGRRIVREQLEAGGQALPWMDMAAFARRAIEVAAADLEAAEARPSWVFFDRGLIDAVVALEHATGAPAPLGRAQRPYRRSVFLAPPWPEIYAADPERRHGFEEAAAEYGRLAAGYRRLGYRAVLLPKASVEARAEFVLERLKAG